MAGQVPECIKHTRAQAVRVEANAAARRFRQSLIGQDLNVLWEQRDASGWTGLTDNYVRVFCASDLDLHNRITRTRITTPSAEGLSGSIVQSEPAGGE
ncbi:MAG: hypothetical protein E6J26_10115 [Chloroflexi bacterium]|nr:MAG: hypothetical protein E6J26_10115 [Chloroflexota bacterium]